MTNAELIKALRWCGGENNEWCVGETYKCPLWNEDRITDDCKAELMTTAADALEAADKQITVLVKQAWHTDQVDAVNFAVYSDQKARIAELEAQAEALKEESEAYKFGYLDGKTESDSQIEDLQTALTACRLRKDEAQLPKEGEWINPSRNPDIVNKDFFSDCSVCGETFMDESNYCPNCGARMTEEDHE